MSKPDLMNELTTALGQCVSDVARPESHFHDGLSSRMTAQPDNVIAWFTKGDQSAHVPWVHRRYLLIVSLRNSVRLGIDTDCFVLHPNMGLLVFPFQTHYYRPGPAAQDYLGMNMTFVLRDRADQSLLPLKGHVFELDNTDCRLLSQFAEFAMVRPHACPGEGVHILSRFLCRKQEEALNAPTPHRTPSETDEPTLYERVVTYINDHLFEQLTVAEIADALALSERHLRRAFREHTGSLTLGRLIRNIRLKKSHEYLMHTDMAIKEIAEKCGYADQFTFSRAFKSYCGTAPTHYRRKRRQTP